MSRRFGCDCSGIVGVMRPLQRGDSVLFKDEPWTRAEQLLETEWVLSRGLALFITTPGGGAPVVLEWRLSSRPRQSGFEGDEGA